MRLLTDMIGFSITEDFVDYMYVLPCMTGLISWAPELLINSFSIARHA
jgi:hypothetical protein